MFIRRYWYSFICLLICFTLYSCESDKNSVVVKTNKEVVKLSSSSEYKNISFFTNANKPITELSDIGFADEIGIVLKRGEPLWGITYDGKYKSLFVEGSVINTLFDSVAWGAGTDISMDVSNGNSFVYMSQIITPLEYSKYPSLKMYATEHKGLNEKLLQLLNVGNTGLYKKGSWEIASPFSLIIFPDIAGYKPFLEHPSLKILIAHKNAEKEIISSGGCMKIRFKESN